MQKKVEKKVKIVKCVVVDNSINKGWNVGDHVEVENTHEWIKKGFLKEVN